LAAARNQGDQSRFGFSVGKRIGNAVTRNRTKRRLREAVWQHRDLIPSGYDLVFIARHSIGQVGFQQIEQAVQRLVLKAFGPAVADQRESRE
jgi:ribonuclease P protein component